MDDFAERFERVGPDRWGKSAQPEWMPGRYYARMTRRLHAIWSYVQSVSTSAPHPIVDRALTENC